MSEGVPSFGEGSEDHFGPGKGLRGGRGVESPLEALGN